jgi:hypothetical protein
MMRRTMFRFTCSRGPRKWSSCWPECSQGGALQARTIQEGYLPLHVAARNAAPELGVVYFLLRTWPPALAVRISLN